MRERGFRAAAAVVGDVTDPAKLRQVFDKYRPGVVFHAAAYKHVAMMEANPLEAVRNNTLGTRVVADVAVEYGAKRFVLVSTDKAANPKTVMGQSKALAEWIVETWGHRADVTTRFVAVRFGNVLGSSGSVVPIFRRQIARGGPVTVTHPEMTRFFMTIPEAVQLIVQAGAIGGRGQVYVLDMGEPVRIVDLAEKMIRLSGKEPGREIAIEFIGPAPGEKLHEELVGHGEKVTPSQHPKIDLITRPPVDSDWLEAELALLERLVEDGETLELVGELRRLVEEPRRERAATPGRDRCHRDPAAGLRRGRRPRLSRRAGRASPRVGARRSGRALVRRRRSRLARRRPDRPRAGRDRRDRPRPAPRAGERRRRAVPAREPRGAAALRRPLRRRGDEHPWRVLPRAVAAERRGRVRPPRAHAEHVSWIAARPPLALEGETLLLHADTPAYLALGRSIDAVTRATRAVLAAGSASEVDDLLGIVSDRMRLAEPEAVRALLDAYGGARIVHGHTPIASLLGVDPQDVAAPLVYGDGLVTNVDHCLFAGGPGFVTRL